MFMLSFVEIPSPRPRCVPTSIVFDGVRSAFARRRFADIFGVRHRSAGHMRGQVESSNVVDADWVMDSRPRHKVHRKRKALDESIRRIVAAVFAAVKRDDRCLVDDPIDLDEWQVFEWTVRDGQHRLRRTWPKVFGSNGFQLVAGGGAGRIVGVRVRWMHWPCRFRVVSISFTLNSGFVFDDH